MPSTRHNLRLHPLDQHEYALRDDPDEAPSARRAWAWLLVFLVGAIFWTGMVLIVVRFVWGG